MKIMKIKAKAFYGNAPDEGIRPDCIIYCDKAAICPKLYGLSLKKWHKSISKIIGKFEPLIPDNLFVLIYVSYDEQMFTSTHQSGRPEEHSVFQEMQFKASLKNFLEFKGIQKSHTV